MSTMSQSRAWRGPTLFSFGFRPFFLGGTLYAGLVVAVWVPWYLGIIDVPTTFAPVTWHIHELLFGYGFAVIAGFLLTAVPNWTGRLPVVGWPLIGLFALWVVARLAVFASASLDPATLAILSLAFPLALVVAMAREIVAGGNTKNLIVIAAVSSLAIAQAVMQYEHWTDAVPSIGGRFGIAAVIFLIMTIGGRITPSFTRNWLRKAKIQREPSPIGRYDMVALAVGGAMLGLWVVVPLLDEASHGLIGAGLIVAGTVHVVRQARWVPDRTLREPLLVILHLGYAFVPIGFILSGLALIAQVGIAAQAGIHAWSVGAIGVMTLAVMTRATLGHTGRALKASAGTIAIYAAVVLAALARIVAALVPDYAITLLEWSGILWCAAFFGFVVLYGPMLLAPRVAASDAG